tara:strand:+ start:145 stop:459 length:315 start_codon:yes stop_codon:yes gene_type:complete
MERSEEEIAFRRQVARRLKQLHSLTHVMRTSVRPFLVRKESDLLFGYCDALRDLDIYPNTRHQMLQAVHSLHNQYYAYRENLEGAGDTGLRTGISFEDVLLRRG